MTDQNTMRARVEAYFERAKKENTKEYGVAIVFSLKHQNAETYEHFNYDELEGDELAKIKDEKIEKNWMKIEEDGFIIPVSFNVGRIKKTREEGEIFIPYDEICGIGYIH